MGANLSLWLQGAGALANAWGNYTYGMQQAKIEKEKLAYAKAQDAKTQATLDTNQENLNNAVSKAFKKKDSLADAYSTTTA